MSKKNSREELREELEEDLDEEEIMSKVKITSRNDKAIGKTIGRRIVLVTLIVAIAVYLLSNTSALDRNKTISSILERVAPYSVMDEAFSNREAITGYDLVERIDYYQELVNISEKLHDYDLSSITANLEHLEMPGELDMNKLNSDMERFEELMDNGVSHRVLSKDSEEFVQLALELEAQEQAVNLTIQRNAFADLADLKLIALKSKVADCCEFPASSIDNMQLLEVNGERMLYYTGGTGMTYQIRFNYGSLDLITSSNLVPSTMDSIFADQTYSGEATTTYNHDINERLLEEINTTRTFMQMDCTINNKGELVLEAPVAIQRLTHAFRNSNGNNENNEN